MNYDQWLNRPDPFVGFGDHPATAVKFLWMRRRRELVPDWSGGEAKLTYHDIHNSDIEATEYHGRKPRTITLRLWFSSRDDRELMDSLQGQAHTLRLPWGLTSRAGGTKETRNGSDYLVLPDTILTGLTDQETSGGVAMATATFRRAYSAA